MLTLRYKYLRPWCFAYVALPFWIFAVSFLRLGWGVALAAITLLTVVTVFGGFFRKKDTPATDTPENALSSPNKGSSLIVPWWGLLLVAVIGAVWVWWSGIGGWFYQSSDFGARNAIFRDLIYYDWPVIYGGSKGALVYYIGFWLPAAAIGKLACVFTTDVDAIWTVANTALYLWTFLGVTLTLLLVAFNVRARHIKTVLLAALMFIFFSGLDVIGFSTVGYSFSKLHLEWWTHARFQYSSVTTCLFWVFNQTVISWVTTLTMLREKSPRYFVFLGMMCLFSGPFPFVGFVVLAAARGVQFVWNNRKDVKRCLTEMLSPSNIISALVLFPVILSYFACNLAVTSNGGASVAGNGLKLDKATFTCYALFILLEVVLYAVVLLYENRKNLVFWANLAFLLVCPFIRVGSASDFCMRASIPGLVYLSLCVIRYLIHNAFKKKTVVGWILYAVLCLTFLIGTMTPLTEFSRGVIRTSKAHTILMPCDNWYSLSTYTGTMDNFVCPTYEDTIFFRYLAR